MKKIIFILASIILLTFASLHSPVYDGAGKGNKDEPGPLTSVYEED